MPHGTGIPIEDDFSATPGAPGPGQGGPPAPKQGFGPRQRAKRLLRQAAGLQPPSDVQPATGLAPAIEAALNLQRAEGLLTEEQFQKALGRTPPTSEISGGPAVRRPLTPGKGPGAATPVPPGGVKETGSQRAALRARARRVRSRRAGLIAGATQAASGPLGASPGLLPQIADLFNQRRTF